jgi:tRNA(Ile)-lysidine synthase
MSLQQGARELRYKFLQNLCSEKHFEKIATAHNADDNAETILLNLFRGTGVTGLAGIPAKRDNIVRPILFATREEIERYADMKGISFRTDSSNAKEDYRRNFIRLKILPVVKKHINPNILTILNRTAEICGELTHSIRTETETVFKTVAIEDKDKIALDIAKLKNYLNFVQCNVVIWTVRSLSKREVDYEKVNAVLKLMKADTGSSLHVFEDLTAYRDRSNLVFIAGTPEKPVSVTVKVGESHSNSRIRFSTRIFSRKPTKFAADRNVEYIDADLIGEKFTVRMWKDGDWFIPLGMTGKKKISDFLIDNKIPVFEKRRIFVAETDGKIVWLCGLRLDDRFKVTKTTKRIAKIDFRYN